MSTGTQDLMDEENVDHKKSMFYICKCYGNWRARNN
jgi:hypothetical protein